MVQRLLFITLFFSVLQAQSVWAQDTIQAKGIKVPDERVIVPPPASTNPAPNNGKQINQTGIIRGKLVDKETGEEMMEALIILEGTQIGTRTDLDGSFSITNVPTGKYNMTISYIGYQKLTITNVEVKGGEVSVINGFMVAEGITTETVVIEAKALKNNESSVLNMQRVSSVSLDGISLAQTQRNGDNTAAASLGRVTGLTVEGGRYVYIRGLGDRYNKTMVNGAEIPGLDPARNSVQLDMFPSNLIDNMIVYKAFAPDLPGSFTGGLIDITTRDFPEKFTLSTNFSLGYNDQASFNKNFLLYKRGGLDWFGIDDGTRAEPLDVRGIGRTLPAASGKYDENPNNQLNNKVVKEFGGEMYPTKQSSFLDHSFSFSAGNQVKVAGKPLGFIASLTYRRNYNYYENGVEALNRSVGTSAKSLTQDYRYDDQRGSDAVLFGALFTLSYKFSANNRISLTYNHSHAGDASARYQVGIFPGDGIGSFRENRVIQYLERSINIFQARGEHFFPKLKNSKLEWTSSFILLRQSEPDLRFMTNEYSVDDSTGKKSYQIAQARYFLPIRFFRTMDETNHDHRLHWTLPIKLGRDESKLKFGGALTQKSRAPFHEKQYDYAGNGLSYYNGDPSVLFAQDRLGVNPHTGDWNIYLKDNSSKKNSYDGLERVGAGYAMADIGITRLIRVVTGVRLESTYMQVISKDELIKPAEISTNDFLPCLNLILRPSTKMNVRINYGRTVARPILREMASYANFDFIGGYVIVGNNQLKRTVIDNIDLKWEFFPNTNEVISFGAFYKNFQNPIERAINPQTTGTNATEIQFRNVDQARCYGIEAEFRKRFMKVIQMGVNASLIASQVDIAPLELQTIRIYRPEAASTRQMFAQSPYILNANIGYQNDSVGFSAMVNYNIFGARIMEVGSSGAPNVYEQPRHTLDMNLQYRKGPFIFRVNMNNLLNPKFRFTQSFNGQEYTFREFTMGRRFTLSVTYQF